MSFYCNLLDPYGFLNLNSYTGVITGKYQLNESFTTTIEIRWIGYDDRWAIDLPIIFNNTDTSGNIRCSNCSDCQSCYECIECNNCIDCTTCNNCQSCSKCINCTDCISSSFCSDCINCDKMY